MVDKHQTGSQRPVNPLRELGVLIGMDDYVPGDDEGYWNVENLRKHVLWLEERARAEARPKVVEQDPVCAHGILLSEDCSVCPDAGPLRENQPIPPGFVRVDDIVYRPPSRRMTEDEAWAIYYAEHDAAAVGRTLAVLGKGPVRAPMPASWRRVDDCHIDGPGLAEVMWLEDDRVLAIDETGGESRVPVSVLRALLDTQE